MRPIRAGEEFSEFEIVRGIGADLLYEQLLPKLIVEQELITNQSDLESESVRKFI